MLTGLVRLDFLGRWLDLTFWVLGSLKDGDIYLVETWYPGDSGHVKQPMTESWKLAKTSTLPLSTSMCVMCINSFAVTCLFCTLPSVKQGKGNWFVDAWYFVKPVLLLVLLRLKTWHFLEKLSWHQSCAVIPIPMDQTITIGPNIHRRFSNKIFCNRIPVIYKLFCPDHPFLITIPNTHERRGNTLPARVRKPAAVGCVTGDESHR